VSVTPLDIRRKEFKRSMRGYSDEEVDVFLDEVADEFERLFQENIELHDRLQRLEEQISGHMQIRDALEKTLISAQLQADDLRANARKEGELMLRDAELKARQIVADSYSETQRVQHALIQLKHLEEDFRFKFRSLLEGHLNLLTDGPIAISGGEPRVIESLPDQGAVPLLSVEPLQVREMPTIEPVAAAPAPSDVPDANPAPVEAPAMVGVVDEEGGAGEISVLPEVEDDEVTAEMEDRPTEQDARPVSDETGERSSSGFFFGRRLEEGDDAFLSPDSLKKEGSRDFEW